MSLSGITELIENCRLQLEGLQISSKNSFQVGSQVQGQGLQTAEKKMNMTIQKINAEYELGCAAATVKRLECKYSREMEAATRNGAIAQLVFIGSALSNAFDAAGDLFGGKENLGDKPKWQQTKPIDPNDKNTSVFFSQGGGSHERTVIAVGQSGDNENVINAFTRNEDGGKFKLSDKWKGSNQKDQEFLDNFQKSTGFRPDSEALKPLIGKTLTRAELEQKLGEMNPNMNKEQLSALSGAIAKQTEIPVAGSFRTGKFSNKQMIEAGGADYQKMKTENGGKDLSFKEIQQKNPELAGRIADQFIGSPNKSTDQTRDMGNGEVDGFLKLVEGLEKKGATAPVKYSDGTTANEPVIRGNTIDEIKRGLIDTGKMTKHDQKGLAGRVGDNLLEGGHSIVGVFVQSAQEAMPYFQAYLNARGKAEKTWKNKSDDGELDLVGAYAKLNAANKKLNQITVNINLFGATEGRSA